jgi:Conserved domain frequently associated with peptide methionine sulfoxide reductase
MRIIIGVLVTFLFVNCTAQKQKPSDGGSISEAAANKIEEVDETKEDLIAEELGEYAHFHIISDTLQKISQAEGDWKSKMSKDRYHVLFEKGTERPFTGALLNNKEKGKYTCGACELPLFHSDHKFKSGTGWPSFFQPIQDGHVMLKLIRVME